MSRVDVIRGLFEQISYKNANSKPIFFQTSLNSYAAHDKFLFIKVPDLRKIAKQFKDLSISEIKCFIISEYNEERLFALIVLVNQFNLKEYNKKKEIFDFYIENIDFVNNWNLVDSSAYQLIGNYCFHNIDLITEVIYSFARSDDLWKKRISIVSTFYFIKKSNFIHTVNIIEILMDDSHHLIQKAIGWMLREIGKKDKDFLVEYLNKNANLLSRISLRYSIEKFSDEERKFFLSIGKDI
jgi:3-methyladenine DNA glycosylase AlkD